VSNCDVIVPLSRAAAAFRLASCLMWLQCLSIPAISEPRLQKVSSLWRTLVDSK
jgi:hypothetical protein